ncbi:MAG: hypothetical protein H7A51_04085 [Akkermansiaceae bacterium]|nr:hypothetical protein [Akkermansiaceae bacterium]
MKHSILLLGIATFLTSCTTSPPVSGTIVTEQGEIRVTPDGRIEVVIEPRPTK